MAEEIIRETISISRTSAHVSDEEKEVSALYNRVVKKGLKHALHVLTWGTPNEKLRITTAAISSASRLAALDAAAEVEEHRLEFERMMDDITQVASSQIVVSGPDAPPPTPRFIDANATTLAIGPNDQDERP